MVTGDHWDNNIVRQAAKEAFRKLNPVSLRRNPVMLVLEVASAVMTVIAVHGLTASGDFRFDFQITLWLWLTVLFANFAEAVAEGRGKAQTKTLRQKRSETFAKRVTEVGKPDLTAALTLSKGEIVLVEEGDTIPCDGELEQGTLMVDESSITGESAPVIREAGGDRSGVTAGTAVLSGTAHVRVTADPGDTFLDHMIEMVESAKRRKTPNEKALEILLIGLTALFIVVVITAAAFSWYMKVDFSFPAAVVLLACLMPTTIGGLLPAIGIAGMERLIGHNVVALSGRAVEAAGDVNEVLLDKTGTITLGNRNATEFIPADGITEYEVAEASLLASLADETPEGRSIVALAKERLGLRGRDIRTPEEAVFLPFTAETRISGVDFDGRKIRKGPLANVEDFVSLSGGMLPKEFVHGVDRVALEGCTPLVVAEGPKVLGIVRLKDILKTGIKERLGELRRLGIRSTMITGDNPLTAASIAAEAGVDDFVAQARPETKLQLIRKLQEGGYLVAMIGDGTNDAPALAQADVAVAMNAGTQAARDAANMVDLDSNPTKLLDIVEIGKQILITRGALTTFSVTNDLAKYFAILPAVFAAGYPSLEILNVMHLATPKSALLSALIFNAIIIPILIPLALRGVRYKSASPKDLLRRNILIYGVGGLTLPFVAIKLIDLLITFLGLV